MAEETVTVAHAREFGREGRFRIVVQGLVTPVVLAVEPSDPTPRLVGQSAACALSLEDPMVSRRHFSLSVEGPCLRITDLRSLNGTWVNGLRVDACFLRGGEVINAGRTRLLVERLGDEPIAMEGGAMSFGSLVGGSAAMRRLHPLLTRLAACDVPVIIEGETGTGKEVAAEAIHNESARANGPFVIFDCTAVAPTLVEAALFGHEKGAFTGATAARRGVFEQAEGGTLLIDEIGDLPLDLQPKLLRAIQRREVQRVGGEGWVAVNTRIVAATRRDLEREVQAGRFREDLFYRLAVGRVELPPLRQRGGDIARLVRHFWDRHGGVDRPIDPELFDAWEDHSWPGNVRELENAVLGRLALGDLAAPLSSVDRGVQLEVPFVVDEPLKLSRQRAIEEFERRYIERLMARYGDPTQVARAAGVSKRYVNMLRSRYDL